MRVGKNEIVARLWRKHNVGLHLGEISRGGAETQSNAF
jgi:hypothetical protein